MIVSTEDLHWVDPESEEVLDRIAARLSRLPILLIATSRPEWHCRWAPAAWLRVLKLSPLSEKSLRCLLIARLDGPQAADLAAAVAHQPLGDPLFAELMLSGLADAGVLLDLGTGFHILREASPGQLPATIRGLLSERVDRLSTIEKRVLRGLGDRPANLDDVARADQRHRSRHAPHGGEPAAGRRVSGHRRGAGTGLVISS